MLASPWPLLRAAGRWRAVLVVALAVFVILLLGFDGVDNDDDAPEVYLSPEILILVLVESGLALIGHLSCRALLLGGLGRSPRSPPFSSFAPFAAI